MITRVNDPQAREALLAEYTALKAEQLGLMTNRDNYFYAMLTALAGIIAGAVTARMPAVLLAGAPVALVFGWTYLAKDIKVSEIGAFIRREIRPRMGDHAFRWELDTEDPRVRRIRKTCQLAADLTAFPLAGAALALTAGLWGGSAIWLPPIAAAEVIASLLLAVPFIVYAELGGKT